MAVGIKVRRETYKRSVRLLVPALALPLVDGGWGGRVDP